MIHLLLAPTAFLLFVLAGGVVGTLYLMAKEIGRGW